MPHCAVCVEPPCLEPLLDQPYQCAVINALRQHPEYPLMVDVVEGFDNLLPLSTTHSLTPHAPGRARHAPPGIFTGYSPIASALACHPPSVDSADGDQTHSGCRGGHDRDGPRVWHMAIRPATLWGLLPHDVQQAIVSDLQTIVSEVIHVYDTSCATPSSQPQSGDLHSAVHRPSGADQPRESAAPTRHAHACPAAGLARGAH